MKEIISLQVGNKSNFVATHLWNSQKFYGDEIDHSCLYSVRQSRVGQVYVPRMVLLDLKASFGSLNVNEIYDDSNDVEPFDSVQVVEQDRIPKNEYLENLDSTLKPSYDLSDQVKSWSDFNSTYFDPKSLMEISAFTHNDEKNRFATFTNGRQIFHDMKMVDELFDERIRKFIEETDLAQGFQIFIDANDGFSGLGASVVEVLREEYRKKSVMVTGIHEPMTHLNYNEQKVAKVNQSLLLLEMLNSGTLYTPLYAPNTSAWSSKMNFENPYVWSAPLAAAIESSTIPFRLSNGLDRTHMYDFEKIMNPQLSTSLLGLELSLNHGEIIDLSMGKRSNNHQFQTASWKVVRGLDKNESKTLNLPNAHKTSVLKEFPLDPSFPRFFVDSAADKTPLITNSYSGIPLEPLISRGISHFEIAKKDAWLKGEFKLGDGGVDDTDWRIKIQEFQEYQDKYQLEP